MALPGSNDAVERAVFGLCGALSGCVALEPPPSDSQLGSGLRPVPQIVVRFAREEYASQGERTDQLSVVLRRLEAMGVLGAVAACRAFTWRRNPVFWLRMLKLCCQASHYDEYFDPRTVSCVHAMSLAAAAGPRDAPASTRFQTSSRARETSNQRAAVEWQQEEVSECTSSARDAEMPSFLLDFSYTDLTPEVLSALRRFLMARAKARKPAWRFIFLKTMGLLGSVARPNRVLPVKIALRFDQCRIQKSVTLTTLRDLLRDVDQRHERRRSTVCTSHSRFVPPSTPTHSPPQGQVDAAQIEWQWLMFAVTHLEVSGSPLGGNDFMRLADIVARARGSPLRELVLNQVFVGATPIQLLPAFAGLMSECFQLSPVVPQEPNGAGVEQGGQEGGHIARQRSIWHLSLDLNTLAEFHLASLFSSVHYGSSGVRKLSLQTAFRGFHSDPTRPWLWLAFGIFHVQSQSSITHLNVSRNVLRPEAVRAVKMLLDSSLTPYANNLAGKTSDRKRWNRDNSSTEERKPSSLCCQRALLPTNTHLRLPLDRVTGKSRRAKAHVTRQPTQVKTSEACWCHVLSLGPEWSSLLAPGFGRLWAKSEAIQRISVPTEADLDSRHSTLTTLDMNAMLSGEDNVAVRGALIPWIQLVGRSLLALHLRSNALLESDLAVILETCPALTLLDVEDCQLQGMQPIIAGYADGSCWIETLNLADNMLTTRDIVDLSRQLKVRHDRPPNLAAVPPLAALHLELNVLERVSYQALLRVMTGGNKTLQLLSLDKAHVADRELSYRLSQCDGEVLGLRPLSPNHRAALLSVAESIPSIQRCDGHVLSLILEFATERVYRQIVWK